MYQGKKARLTLGKVTVVLLSCQCCFMQVGALVITPTRELALQISGVMEHFIQKFPQFK